MAIPARRDSKLNLSLSPCRPIPLSPCLLAAISPCLLLLLVTAGCASFSLPGMNLEKYMPALAGRTKEFRRPLRMVAFWTDTVRTSEGQPAMRGFGGRLMFFEREHGKSIKVAGTLTIYAFDESAHAEEDNPRPDRKYVFTPDQFAKHYSKSELGHSYSVWIPWDKVGGEAKEIGLICRFTPLEGGAVVSEQVRQALPGFTPDAESSPPATQLTQFKKPATGDNGERMVTTTIDLDGPPDRRLPMALARERPTWQSQSEAAMAINPKMTTNVVVPALGQQPAGAQPAGAQAAGEQAVGTSAADARATPASWLARFGPHQARVPGAPIVPPDRARGPWRPTQVIPQSFQQASPAASLPPTSLSSVVAELQQSAGQPAAAQK